MDYKYEFVGHRAYQNYDHDIKKRIKKEIGYEDSDYYIAINEAVCNAVRYGINGVENTKVRVIVSIRNSFLKVKVESESKEFDVFAFRERLKNIPDQTMDWRKLFKNTLSGRGIWLMLSGTDHIVWVEKENAISLYLRKPYRLHETRRIEDLIPRFLIEREGAII